MRRNRAISVDGCGSDLLRVCSSSWCSSRARRRDRRALPHPRRVPGLRRRGLRLHAAYPARLSDDAAHVEPPSPLRRLQSMVGDLDACDESTVFDALKATLQSCNVNMHTIRCKHGTQEEFHTATVLKRWTSLIVHGRSGGPDMRPTIQDLPSIRRCWDTMYATMKWQA